MKPILILLIVSIHFTQDLYGGTHREVASVINPDGTINLNTGFSGSLDLSASQVILDPENGPVLSPPMLTPDWYPLGPGLNSTVYSIMILGNDVYAGGDFVDAGGDADADYLARWDGCEWHAVGPGLDGTVFAIELNGGNIYIGGNFTAPFNHIGFWNGSQWNAMGSGLNATVFTLASSGSDIYAGGGFTDAGGNANGDYVAKWNGSSWQNLGPGLNDEVYDIEVNGNDVYAGGFFLNAGGNPDADIIARWDGTSWNNLGPAFIPGIGLGIFQLELDGNNVYVSGYWGVDNYSQMAYWDGSEWHSMDFVYGQAAQAMLIYGNNMYVSFYTSDCAWLQRYDLNGQYWEDIPMGSGCFYTSVYAFAYNGIDLYAGGDFIYGSGCPECNIMRYGEPGVILIIAGVPASICQTDPPLSLPTTQSGYTGNWSGQGVTNNIFNPTGLNGDITLTFTPDPGQCVSPVDAIIIVNDCAPPPCPTGFDTTVIDILGTCANSIDLEWLSFTVFGQMGGTWDGLFNSTHYDPCVDGNGPFYYSYTPPGCATIQDTLLFDWTYDPPCDWQIQNVCYGSDVNGDWAIYFTIPAFPGNDPPFDYWLLGWGLCTIGQYSSEMSYSLGNTCFTGNCPENCPTFCAQIGVNPLGGGCVWYFGGIYSFNNAFTIYGIECCYPDDCCEPSDCMDPPYAGESSSITVCNDEQPFDLTTALGGDPDAGGTWSPPLSSGGNIYDPILDGSGTFTYTVSASDCPDDAASVTVAVLTPTTPVIVGVPGSICEAFAPIALPTNVSGITGDWSGIGVTNNSFNPDGLDGFITLSFTPQAGQCALPADWDIQVIPVVTPGISGIPDSLCSTSPPISLPVSLDGINGNWSGSGVANNIFNPNGLSGNILLTFSPNANECADPASAMINVSPAITPTISGVPDSLCQTDPSVNLPIVQNGVSGIWSGNGVMNNVFNPTGLNGSISITFTPDANQCANTATTSIQVSPVIIPLISGIPASVCVSSPPLSLANVQNGIAGEWSGQNVTNNVFDPAGLMGNIILTFTPEAGQCATIATTSISVAALLTPIIMGVPALLCETEAPVPLPGIQNGINGNWSGAGVSNNNFDPSGLTGIITLTFVPDTGQCATSALTNITIEQSLIPNISGIPSTVCEADAAIPLPNVQEGISGDWSGPGVTNNIFNPSGFSGSVSLLFTPNAGMCASANSIDIMVEMAITPFISGIPDQLCQSANSIALSISQDGILGNWSGTGVSNNIFDPSGLNGNSILSFTPVAGQCANGAMTSIDVVAPVTPGITGVPGSLCETSDSIFLSAVQSGFTGNWSGQGVFNNLFDPVGLNGSIQLSFTPDTGQCAITATLSISVNVAPSFQNLMAICDSLAESYVVSFDISGGASGTYVVNGVLVTGPGFVSLPIDNDSTQYVFTLDDTNACGPVIISGSKNCACATYAGTMNFNTAPLKICIGSQLSVIHNGDQNLDTDDLLAFVLHDNAGTQLGTIYAISSTTSFTVPVGIILGQTYFISSIAGSNDGTGNVDLTDGCLSVSQGIPVVFYQPDAIISPGGNICQSDCFTYQVQLSGEKPFTLAYQLIVNGIPYAQMISSDTSVVNLIICPSDYGVAAGNMDIVLTNLTDINCTVPLSPIGGTEIFVHPEVTADFSTILCDGESIIIHNTLYDQSHPDGIETFPGGSVFGCDSIVNISLTFYPEAVFDLHETLCFGANIVVNGTVYNESNSIGTEIFPNDAINGCDSIVNVLLEFDSIVITDLSLALCSGESILINGTTYDESHPVGSELFIDGSAFGCDSLVNVNLTFYPPSFSDIRDTLCNGERLIVNGNVYDAFHPNGIEILKNGNISECDSTVFINLTFNPEVIFMIDDTLNAGDSLVINGTTYNQLNSTGTELIPFGSIHGCDSTIVVNLHFRSVALTANLEVVSPLCYGESTGSIIIENIAGGFAVYRVKLDTNSVAQVDIFPYQFTGLRAGIHSIRKKPWTQVRTYYL